MENKKLIFEMDEMDSIENFFDSFLEYKKEKITKFIKEDDLIQKNINDLKKTIQNVGNRIIQSNEMLLKHLVAGHVQSGKTDFVIGLISYILDNINKDHINIFVNLTSSNTSIMSQNHQRLKDFFDNYNNQNLKIIEIKSYDELKSKKNNFRKNTIYIWSFLKNTTHLNWLKENILNIHEDVNLIILDDEGDNASFNTKETSKSDDLSAINKYINDILNLKKNVHKINYVSITATPFIHFFATNSNNIKPDYSYLLKPGSNYSSIIDFNELINQQDSKVVSIIDENIDDIDDFEDLPKSLKVAILVFLINSAIIKNRVSENFFSRMIISSFPKISEQTVLVNLINDYLDNFKENKILFYEEIDKNEILSQVYEGNEYTEDSQEKIKKYVYEKFILKSKYEIIEFNSNNKDNINNLNLDHEIKKLQIIVGLYKMSWGITISNLSTIFFTFRSRTISLADTLLQRARWLGYRKNYINRIKIFMTEELKNDYLVIGDLINNLYNIIEISENKNIPFTNLEKFLGISNVVQKIMPVGSNRAKTYLINENHYNNIFINNSYNSGKDNNNLKLLEIFKSYYKNKKEDKTNWPILECNNLQDFINIFFQDNYDNFYSCFNIKKVKFPNINTLLDKKVVVRFISKDLNNIFFRERIIINKNEDKYYFGNGNYEGEYTINNKDWIIIDFLPLKIWEKNNNFEKKIIRPKLLLPYDIENNKNIDKKFSSGFIGED